MEISEIMTKRTKSILERLDERYTTEFRCSLNYTTPWELLAATMLSAQCTDERVNIVTKDLFVKYPDVSAVAHADVKEMEQDFVHATVGYTTPDEELDLDYCKEAVAMEIPYALSNSLGFGGHNASILVKKYVG